MEVILRKPDDKLIKGIIAIAAIIVMVALMARYLGRSETLADYAAKHPDEQISVSVSPGVTAYVSPDANEAEDMTQGAGSE